MRTKRKISKKAIALTLAVSTMAGSFATAYAADYNFTIVRAIKDKTKQVWKDKTGAIGEVSIEKASAPSYYTTFGFYCYDDLISNTPEVQNQPGKSALIIYDNDATGKDFWVNLRGWDNRLTAPNYSTVSGTWNPVR